MENNDLKKLVTGLSLVALLGGAGLTVSGCATTGSGSEAKAGTADSSAAAKVEVTTDEATEEDLSLTG